MDGTLETEAKRKGKTVPRTSKKASDPLWASCFFYAQRLGKVDPLGHSLGPPTNWAAMSMIPLGIRDAPDILKHPRGSGALRDCAPDRPKDLRGGSLRTVRGAPDHPKGPRRFPLGQS